LGKVGAVKGVLKKQRRGKGNKNGRQKGKAAVVKKKETWKRGVDVWTLWTGKKGGEHQKLKTESGPRENFGKGDTGKGEVIRMEGEDASLKDAKGKTVGTGNENELARRLSRGEQKGSQQ